MEEAEGLKNIENSGVCRVCMQCDSEDSFSMLDEYNNCKISIKINALTNVCVREGDGLPDRICPTCLLELESAFKFKLKCENTNKVLQSLNKVSMHTQVEYFDYVSDPIKTEYLDDEDGYEAPLLGEVSTQFDSSDDVADSNKEEYLDSIYSDIDDYNVDQIMSAEFSQHGKPDPGMQPHMKTPVPSRAIDLKLECHDCGGSFKSKCKLRTHWNKVHLREHLKCPKCKRQFKQYTPYNLHMKQSCIDTNKVRVEGEGKNRVFHCKECNYQNHRPNAVAKHSVVHSGERPYQCDICYKSFPQRASIFSHKESVHNIYKTDGTCPHCGKYIQGKIKMSTHIRKAHRSVSCEICKKVLKYSSLANHMRRHSGVKEYVCEVCSFACYTHAELITHKNTVHLPRRKFQCNICNYTCKTNRVLETHKSKHTDTNTVCLECGRFLDNARQLALHMTKHIDRKYQCATCEKRFNLRKSLVTHIKTQHKIKS